MSATATDDRPAWNAMLAVPVVIVALIAGVVGFGIAGAIRDAVVSVPSHTGGLTGVAVDGTPPFETIASTIFQDVALAIGVLLAAWLAGAKRLSLASLGLRGTRVGSSVAYALIGYVVFLLVSAAWTSALSISARENIPVEMGTRDSAWALIGACLLVGAIAPMAEELFFRGFVFGALRRFGFPVAALVTGLLFGAAHVASAPIGYIVPLAVLGVILCGVYERTGSLYPGMALHSLNNAVALGAGDGRGWIVPACLVGSGLVMTATLRGVRRVASQR